jgi:hypothetical protein
MPRPKNTPETIIGKLREAEVLVAKGSTVAEGEPPDRGYGADAVPLAQGVPVTSRSRSGSTSMISNTFSPKAFTIFLAYTGPIPRIIPEPRCFSMPSIEVGSEARMKRALNCWPWVRSLIHSPDAVTHSFGDIVAAWSTTVTRSRWLRALIRRTQKPLSAL